MAVYSKLGNLCSLTYGDYWVYTLSNEYALGIINNRIVYGKYNQFDLLRKDQ